MPTPALPPAPRPTTLPEGSVKPTQATNSDSASKQKPADSDDEAKLYPLDIPSGSAAVGEPVGSLFTDQPYLRPNQDAFWITGGYTAAWIRTYNLPPLVTTGAKGDNPPGALGQPGTAVTFGNGPLDYGTAHGGFLDLGVWLDAAHHYSLDFTGFIVAPSSVNYSAASDNSGNPSILRPAFSTINNRQVAFVDALPGTSTGGVNINARQLLLGGEFNARYHAYCWGRLHADALLGFRTLHLEEGFETQDRLQPLVNDVFTFQNSLVGAGSTITDDNRIKTLNTFYGAQVGGRLRWEYDWMYIDVFGKIGVGVNNQVANISGSSTLITPASSTTVPGGLLALPSNIGDHSRNQVGYIREAGLNFGFDVMEHLRLKVGYSFLSWSGVVRPGNVVDPVVNPHQVPTDQSFGQPGGPARPAFVFKDEVLWAHFVNLGMEFHY
jgi:hypothetical protein